MTQRISVKNRERIIVLQFVLPALIILCIFVFYPILKSICMAFQSWNLISSSKTHPFWIKILKQYLNYHISCDDRKYFNLDLFSVSGKMILGLLVALLLIKIYRAGFVRGLMLIPWAMPTVVVCNVFRIALDPNYGILCALLEKLPIFASGLNVFSGKISAMVAVLLIGIWKNFPFISLMILATLGGIPKDYYDAASIDGANSFMQFKNITWPQIKPIWNTLLVLQILWTVKEFELIYLITKGGPDNATNVIGIDIYLNAFKYYKVGLASAEGVLLLLFCMIFAAIYFRNINKEEKI